MQHRLDIRDAASLRSWREFSNEAGSQSSRHDGNAKYEREPGKLHTVGPIDERVPEAIEPLEDQSKDGAYKAAYATYGKSQERQSRQPIIN